MNPRYRKIDHGKGVFSYVSDLPGKMEISSYGPTPIVSEQEITKDAFHKHVRPVSGSRLGRVPAQPLDAPSAADISS